MKQNKTKSMMGKKKFINVLRKSLRKIVLFLNQLTFKKIIIGLITLIAYLVFAICGILLFFVAYERTYNPNYIRDNIQFIIILILLIINSYFTLHYTTKK